MLFKIECISCGDTVTFDYPIPKRTRPRFRCVECLMEMKEGEIPLVTDSTVAAPNTGLTKRQRHKIKS